MTDSQSQWIVVKMPVTDYLLEYGTSSVYTTYYIFWMNKNFTILTYSYLFTDPQG